jgi:polyferredoxin
MPGPKGTVRSPIMVIVYSMITCGIYSIWWWYTIMTELKNFTQDEEINPTTNLILLLVLSCIWMFILPYKMGKWIAKAQRLAGLPEEDKSTTWLILSLLCLSVFVTYMIQVELNKIWEAGGAAAAAPAPGGFQPPTPGAGM